MTEESGLKVIGHRSEVRDLDEHLDHFDRLCYSHYCFLFSFQLQHNQTVFSVFALFFITIINVIFYMFMFLRPDHVLNSDPPNAKVLLK